jgi:hypothetical protein
MKTLFKYISIPLMVLMLGAVSGCDNDDDLGDHLDDIGDEIGDVGDEISDGAEDAADNIEDNM